MIIATVGRWRALAAALAAGLLAGCGSEADRLVGTWQGTLDVGKVMPQAVAKAAALRLVCHFQKGSDGALTGTLDSPDQGVSSLVIDTVALKDGALHLQVNRVHGGFDGQVSKDHAQITGQWKQGPVSLPLSLQKNP